MIEKIVSGSHINGSLQKGNYVWGVAMNLAWNELCANLNHGPLDLTTKDDQSNRMAFYFNNSPFILNDMSPESCYVKSGYGPEILKKINAQVKQKFPNKSFSDLQLDLSEKDIIAYAYLFKDVQYLQPFTIQDELYFRHTKGECVVKGFKATSYEQFQNISLIHYDSDQQFVIRLKLKQPNEELFVVKGHMDKLPQDIFSLLDGPGQSIKSDDHFAMPMIQLEVQRKYSELVGAKVKSGELKGYQIMVMFEKIKFKIDEKGAKVENEAGFMCGITSVREKRPKRLIVDEPFWIVMKQTGRNPYFLLQINNAEFMEQKK